MLDGTLKTLLVDDSQPVANLMVVICTKIGKSSKSILLIFYYVYPMFHYHYMMIKFKELQITMNTVL